MQELDNRISELQHEIAALPKNISHIEKALESHNRRLEADRAAVAANQRERKQIEGEIQVQEQKISKLKGQMLEAKTNEQYTAFKHEIEYCENAIRMYEDRILERMGESERLEQNVKAAEGALARERHQVEAEKKVAQERTAQSRQRLDEAKKRRAELVSAVAPAVYRDYERIKKTRKGVGVAEVTDGSCSACHMTARLQFMRDLRRGDEIMHCESCGRILFYNPPVETDEAGPSTEEAHPIETAQ